VTWSVARQKVRIAKYLIKSKGGYLMYRQPRHYYDWSRVPLILDVAQAAILLQITPEHLARMCKAGTIPAAQFGKGWRIERDVIRAKLAAGGGGTP
jgi:excisionase family DNA binding protein